MKSVIAILLLITGAMSQAAEPAAAWMGNHLAASERPQELRVQSFDSLLTSAVPSRAIAQELATEYWFAHHGLLAEESLSVTALLRAGRQIKDFATAGEWFWEVRVLHLDGVTDGVIWINAHSKVIRAIGPEA